LMLTKSYAAIGQARHFSFFADFRAILYYSRIFLRERR